MWWPFPHPARTPRTQGASPDPPGLVNEFWRRATKTEGWGWASSSLLVLVFISLPFSLSPGDREVGRCSKMAQSAVLSSDGHCFPAFTYRHPLTSVHSGHRPGLVLGIRNACGHKWPLKECETAEPDLRENHQLLPHCSRQGLGSEGWFQSGNPERGKVFWLISPTFLT